MHRRTIHAVLAAVAAALLVAPVAQADPTIAGAGTVVPGTQQFGNTLCADPPSGSACPDKQYWRLNATSGDRVTIDWEHGGDSTCDYATYLYVWPEGTTDFSINNVESLFSYTIGNNSKAQSQFDIPQTGTYPIEFRSCYSDSGGPYDFSTTVEHAAKLFISKPHAKSKVKRTSSVTVTVRNPDGAPLSGLPVRLTGVWKSKNHKLGTATSAAGVATFQLHLPKSTRGKQIKLRASLSGVDGYLSARSSTIKLKVKR